MRPESTLLSDMEPIEGVINAIRAGSERAERISRRINTERPILKRRVSK
ncbi:Putative regulator [Enterobacter hormaechei]|nr:Putative regulator [Enterobacter hormaechei]